MLSTLSIPLQADEGLVIQTVLGPARRPQVVPKHAADPTASVWSTIAYGQTEASAETRQRLKQRYGQAGFGVTVRLGVAGPRGDRRRQLIRSLLGALAIAQSPGVRMELVPERTDRLDEARAPWSWPLRLSVEEIATLLAWPYPDDELPGLPPLHPLPLRANARVHSGSRVFAVSAVPGDERRLGIATADQTYHAVTYGPSGSGKTNVLLHLIVADMQASALSPSFRRIAPVFSRGGRACRVAGLITWN